MVLYCAQQFLGMIKNKIITPIFKFHHMQQMQADTTEQAGALFWNWNSKILKLIIWEQSEKHWALPSAKLQITVSQ